jgi:hypothetical protein
MTRALKKLKTNRIMYPYKVTKKNHNWNEPCYFSRGTFSVPGRLKRENFGSRQANCSQGKI